MKLLESAKSSIGTSEGLVSSENELSMLLEDYENKIRQLEKTMALIEELAMQIPGFEKMLEIKGVGLVVDAGFLAEVGDIFSFSHPNQMQSCLGQASKRTVPVSIRVRQPYANVEGSDCDTI